MDLNKIVILGRHLEIKIWYKLNKEICELQHIESKNIKAEYELRNREIKKQK